MEPTEQKNYSDIFDQAASLPQTVEMLSDTELPTFATEPGRSYIFTGCGSSYYVAQCGAQFMRALGNIHAYAVPSSEVWLLPELYLRKDSVLVAISRTGTTTEVIRALERARDRQVPAVGISLSNEGPMSDLTDFRLELSHVNEVGRVMMQSFSNMLFAVQWLVAKVAQISCESEADCYISGLSKAANAIGQVLSDQDRQAQAIAQQDPQQYVFLGSGPLSGICAEAELKIKEMTQVATESCATLEFRHGPIATLTDRSIVALASCPRTLVFDKIVADDVRLLGGTAVVVGPGDVDTDNMPGEVLRVKFPNELPDWLYGNVALPFFQLLAYHQAVRLGKDPDSVCHLDKNVEPHIDPHVLDLGVTIEQ